MPKDDPLGQTQPRRVLWLGKENMAEARDNYYSAYQSIDSESADRRTWNTAWAASIAAFSFLMEGRTEPR